MQRYSTYNTVLKKKKSVDRSVTNLRSSYADQYSTYSGEAGERLNVSGCNDDFVGV